MKPPPDSPQPARWTGLFLIFLCMVMPGVALALFGVAWRFWSLERRFGEILTPQILIVGFLALAFGCCVFAGWIATVGFVESRRRARWIEAVFLMLLAQTAIVPVVGILAWFLFTGLFR